MNCTDYKPKNYIVVPNEIICNKNMDAKRIMLFSYLCCRRAMDGTAAFSISELCRWANVKPNRQKGKANDVFITLLSVLQKEKYITWATEEPKTTYDATSYYNVQLNADKFDANKRFCIIYLDEIRRITGFKDVINANVGRITTAHVLLVLAYIRVNIYRKEDKPMCCYRLYEKIAADIGISERFVSKAVDVLDELKIIKHVEPERTHFKNNAGVDCFNTKAKIFADYYHYDVDGEIIESYSADEEIRKQIELLKKQNNNKWNK